RAVVALDPDHAAADEYGRVHPGRLDVAGDADAAEAAGRAGGAPLFLDAVEAGGGERELERGVIVAAVVALVREADVRKLVRAQQVPAPDLRRRETQLGGEQVEHALVHVGRDGEADAPVGALWALVRRERPRARAPAARVHGSPRRGSRSGPRSTSRAARAGARARRRRSPPGTRAPS